MKKEDFNAAREVLGDEEVYEKITQEAEGKAREKAAQEYREKWHGIGILCSWYGLAIYAGLMTIAFLGLNVSRTYAWHIVSIAQDREKEANVARNHALDIVRSELKAEKLENEKKIIAWKHWFLEHHFNPDDLPRSYDPSE